MLKDTRFPKRTDKMLAKRQRSDKEDTLGYQSTDKNLSKMNPRMGKNARTDKQDMKAMYSN